jgi:hypothetical protein
MTFAAAKAWARLARKCADRRGRDDERVSEYRRAALLDLEIALAERDGRKWCGPFSAPWGRPARDWRGTP